VGVAWFGTDADFQAFVDKYSLTFPTISDDPGDVFAHFEVPAQPALAVVDADGNVRVELGAVESDALDDLLTELTG
jgi:peroxiredoxin